MMIDAGALFSSLVGILVAALLAMAARQLRELRATIHQLRSDLAVIGVRLAVVETQQQDHRASDTHLFTELGRRVAEVEQELRRMVR